VPIAVAARAKAWVYGRSLYGTVGSNPARGHEGLSVVSVVCCHVGVSASGRALVQRSTECNREASIKRRPWTTMTFAPLEKKMTIINNLLLPSSGFKR
jgi:hypothetical protein